MANTLPFGVQSTYLVSNTNSARRRSFYLSNKINGLQSEKEAAFMPDCELYANQEPWEIFQDHAGDAVDGGGLYCFTRLKKAPGNRIRRTVGKGTWLAAGKVKVYQVKVCGKTSKAYHKRFVYRNKDSDQNKRWSLHEYSCNDLSDAVVICRLEKNPVRSYYHDLIHVQPVAAPTPTLERKSADDVCSESKRMRSEVQSPPTTNPNSARSSGVEEGGFVVPEFNPDNCNGVSTDMGLNEETNTENDEVTYFYASDFEEERIAGGTVIVTEDNCCGMSTDMGLNKENGEEGTEPSYNITEDAAVASK